MAKARGGKTSRKRAGAKAGKPSSVPATPAAGKTTTPTTNKKKDTGSGNPRRSDIHPSAKGLKPMEQVLWAARLKKAKEAVTQQMDVHVIGGQLVRRYTSIDNDEGLFEIETDKGFYIVVLSKSGQHSIYWRHDEQAMA